MIDVIEVMLDKDKGAIMPKRAHKNDAGLDFFAPRDIYINGGCFIGVDTGVHILIPEGYVGLMKSKSGYLFSRGMETDGTVDADYTGSIGVWLLNNSSQPIAFKRGEKIAQMVILPCICPEPVEVDSFPETERGSHGFGSTGK